MAVLLSVDAVPEVSAWGLGWEVPKVSHHRMFMRLSPTTATTAALLSTGDGVLSSGLGIWAPAFPGTGLWNHWEGDSVEGLCLSFPMAQGCQTCLLGRCFQGTWGGADPHVLA